MKNYLILLFAFLAFGCSQKIYPDRSQYLKDGEEVPTIQLERYKSVQLRPGQDSELAVALAISGGGSRAANLGIGIMLGLEDFEGNRYRNLLKEVDYLSTVSGGGFAAGAYISSLFTHQQLRRESPFSLEEHLDINVRESLAYSYTGALIRANFNPRLWFSPVDDGDGLEKAIDDQVLGYRYRKQNDSLLERSILLEDCFVPADASQPVTLPMHITNSSTLQTMTIFPFTPCILERYKVNGYTHRLRKTEKRNLNPYRVPLAVGIKASGSFPVLISNSTLSSTYSSERPYLHLIDGAMTDNIGYYSALEVLKQDSAKHKILLIIDADAVGNRYTFSQKEGALFSLGVAARLPSSGLDARRATLQRDVIEACRPHRIQQVFFSFNALIEGNEAPLPTVIQIKEEQHRLIRLLRSGQEIDDADKQILYELLTHIGTKYSIEPEEQELLLLGGQLIVKLRNNELLEALR
jgi:hypothetical protein